MICLILFTLKENYLVKMWLIFDGFDPSCIIWYLKVFWVGAFECKYQLNLTCHPMKFHNCHHTNPIHPLVTIPPNPEGYLLSLREIPMIFDCLWKYPRSTHTLGLLINSDISGTFCWHSVLTFKISNTNKISIFYM